MANDMITREQKTWAKGHMEKAVTQQDRLLHDLGISPEAFSRVAVNALVRNPQLAACTKDSLYQAIYDFCDLGILPDGRHGAIVPLPGDRDLRSDVSRPRASGPPERQGHRTELPERLQNAGRQGR